MLFVGVVAAKNINTFFTDQTKVRLDSDVFFPGSGPNWVGHLK